MRLRVDDEEVHGTHALIRRAGRQPRLRVAPEEGRNRAPQLHLSDVLADAHPRAATEGVVRGLCLV